MADNSKIEWTDATWNPIRACNKKTGKVGWHCEHATTGCEYCYSEGFNKRLGTGLPFKPGHRDDIELFLDMEMLLAPLRWKKPRMIFPNSMTDLFAGFVPDEWIDMEFAIMALCPQHTFQVLTKRAERMRDWLTDPDDGRGHINSYHRVLDAAERMISGDHLADFVGPTWPLPNVWLGVSTERQKEADERIPLLLQTPAAVRFISAEPLLGPIDLIGTLARYQDSPERRHCAVPLGRQLINWVIVGGESGPNARPMHPDWARALRDQCAAAGTKFFFKQWGAFEPDPDSCLVEANGSGTPDIAWPDGTIAWGTSRDHGGYGMRMTRVGKKAAGRLLDGITHDDMPGQPDHVITPPARRAAAAE